MWSRWTTGGPPRISRGPQRVPGLRFEHALEFTDLCAMQFRQVVHEVWSIGYFLKTWSMRQKRLKTTDIE